MGKIDYRYEVKNYKNQMTPSERMEKYMAGEVVDHIPYSIMRIENPLIEPMGYTTSDYNNNFDVMAEVIQRGMDDYGIHGISAGLGLRTLGAACGSVLSWPKHGVDHVEEFILEDSLDISDIEMPDPRDNKILTPILDLARKLKDRFPKESLSTGVAGVFTSAAAFRPVEKLLKDTRKNKEEVDKLLEFCLEANLNWIQVFVEEFGPVSVSIAEPVSSNDLLSPKQFEKVSLPYLTRLVDGIIETTGKKPSLHICGHTKGIWPYLSELNIGTFSVDNCEDMEEVKQAFGDKMPIVGNVPPTDALRLGTPEDVVEAVKECIRKAADSPNGYIVSSGCATALGTPIENMDAYVYAIRKYGANARKGEVPEAVYQD